jgi:hypothetical protein
VVCSRRATRDGKRKVKYRREIGNLTGKKVKEQEEIKGKGDQESKETMIPWLQGTQRYSTNHQELGCPRASQSHYISQNTAHQHGNFKLPVNSAQS